MINSIQDNHIIPQISSSFDESKYVFYDIFDYPNMILGAANFSECHKLSTYYISDNTLPSAAKTSLYCSGGIQIRFTSNSRTVILKYATSDKQSGNFQHTGICNREGISCLFRSVDSPYWLPYDMTFSRSEFGVLQLYMSSRLTSTKNSYEIIVNLPILAHINGFSVGIEHHASFTASNLNPSSPIAFLGSHFTFGIGLTSSAFLISNAISRRFNINTYNFGINDCNPHNIAIAKLIGKLNLSAIVIECDNPRQDNQLFFQEFYPFLEHLSHCHQIPIVLLSQVYTRNFKNDYQKRREYIISCIDKLNRQNIYFIDGMTLFNDTQKEYCALSSNLLNDYAAVKISKTLYFLLKQFY